MLNTENESFHTVEICMPSLKKKNVQKKKKHEDKIGK